MDRNKSCYFKTQPQMAPMKSFLLFFCSNEKQKRSANKIFAKEQHLHYTILPSSKDLKAKFIN